MKNKWMICPICRGEGTHVNPDIDANGFEPEDADDAKAYMSGVYNVRCQTCGGSGKILAAEHRKIMKRLAEHAADRRLAAMEDGDVEGYMHAHDYRYG